MWIIWRRFFICIRIFCMRIIRMNCIFGIRMANPSAYHTGRQPAAGHTIPLAGQKCQLSLAINPQQTNSGSSKTSPHINGAIMNFLLPAERDFGI